MSKSRQGRWARDSRLPHATLPNIAVCLESIVVRPALTLDGGPEEDPQHAYLDAAFGDRDARMARRPPRALEGLAAGRAGKTASGLHVELGAI